MNPQIDGSRYVESTRFVNKMFFRVLIPSLAASIWLALSNIVDSVAIGQKLQESGLAAVSLNLPIYMIYFVLMNGLSNGGALTYTKLLSSGKLREARIHFTQIEATALCLGGVFFFLGLFFTPQIMQFLGASRKQPDVFLYSCQYGRLLLLSAPLFMLNFTLYEFIRNDDGELRAMIGFICGTVADIILNFVFVLGMELGVRGAIFATMCGQAVAIAVFAGHLTVKGHILRVVPARLNFREIAESLRLGLASSSKYLMQCIFLYAANRVLLSIHGTLGVAVFTFILNISYVAFSLFDGSLSTMQPLAATFTGEYNPVAAKRVLRKSVLIGSGMTALLIVLGGVFPQQLCACFGLTDPETVREASHAVRVFLISVLPAGWNMLYGGFAQAVGKERWCFLMTLLRSFMVLMVCLIVFSIPGELSLFWWLYPVTEVLCLGIWSLLRHFYGRDFLGAFDEERILRTGFTGDLDEMQNVLAETEAFCEKWNAAVSQLYFVTLTVEEICTLIRKNAFEKHPDAKKQNYIQITLIAERTGEFELRIRDNAQTYNPFEEATRRISSEDSLEGLETIGVLVVKTKAKSFFYRRYLGFNVLVIHV